MKDIVDKADAGGLKGIVSGADSDAFLRRALGIARYAVPELPLLPPLELELNAEDKIRRIMREELDAALARLEIRQSAAQLIAQFKQVLDQRKRAK